MNAERTNVHTASNYGHGHILTYLDSPILFLLQQTHITNLHITGNYLVFYNTYSYATPLFSLYIADIRVVVLILI